MSDLARYFDYNATSPLSPGAREAWVDASDRFWYNPSSLYREAGAARRLLEEAREDLADRLGAEPERVVFTSGASEGNHALMRHIAAEAAPDSILRFSAIEHPSLRDSAVREFGRQRLVELAVDSQGRLDPGTLTQSLDGQETKTALVSVMAANNETGVIQPWRELAAACRDKGVAFHTDAAQWIGKLPVAGMAEACDFVTGSAHKFGGPKGTGFLILSEAAVGRFRSAVGGPQENGHRAGTENLPGILSMMAAWRDKEDDSLRREANVRKAGRTRFEAAVTRALPGVAIVAEGADRLWNTAMLVMPKHSNLKWLTRLSDRGYAVSTGSACSAGKGAPSRVMTAMGLGHEEMGRVLRVSAGWQTTVEDWEGLAAAMKLVFADLAAGRRPGVAG